MTKINEETLKEIYKKAYEYEAEFGGCPQAVLAALKEHFSFIDEKIIKTSHFLAGGVARSTQGTCGALTGGVMAISAELGRERAQFGQEKTLSQEEGSALAALLTDRFMKTYDGITCERVQKKLFGRAFNLRDEEEWAMFEEAGGHLDKCPSVTGNVACWTAELLSKGNSSTGEA